MQLPPADWSQDADFIRFKSAVHNINVVCDAFESAVKDVSDFADYCQDPDRRDDVVRVVNSHGELFELIAKQGE